MARKGARQTTAEGAQSEGKQVEKNNLPKTTLTGVNAENTKSVLISAVLEVHGQVRFGDGTDVGLTITETDMVLRPLDGTQLQKFIFAGSKRRGVDRRTIHELRDQHWEGEQCYIPNLCCACPTCWLYGFTGTTQDKPINAKSRVLYSSSVSVEEVQLGVNTHSRNQVDEKTQTTAGSAGIHEEQIIVAGVHFPTYTALVRVLDWEIGLFAHALLENVNSNRYTAASRAQGGMKFAEHDRVPLIIVDESEQGIFPLAVPKIAGWENDWQRVSEVFHNALSRAHLQTTLEAQGFEVVGNNEGGQTNNQPGLSPDDPQQAQGNEEQQPSTTVNRLTLTESNGVITVKQNGHVLMTRYIGEKALGYLRQKQLTAKQTLTTLKATAFHPEINSYIAAINPKGGGETTVPAGTEDQDSGGSADVSTNE
ncbi:MAG: type I-D CRISPR-associated protein Cas7/Csc2 [Candidatus Binatia bacterium]